MSDYEKNKYYKKKISHQNKESSSRNFYGGRSPTASSSYSKFERDKETKSESIKVKQPTILLKARDHSEETGLSPKRVQKDNDTHSSISSNPSSDSHQTPTVKSMTKPVKFLEDSMLFPENVQEFIQENSDFRVVGVVGAQSVGKSTILNLIAHCSIDENAKRVIFNNCTGRNEEEWGDTSQQLNNLRITEEDRNKHEIFKIQTTEDVETNANCTHGIDLYITSDRVIYLDCQPFLSISVLDDLIKSENKRSNLVSEFIPLENSSEIQGLQLTAFLMSVCHVLVVVQDYFFDSNVVRFLQTAEMLKPTHSNPEDDLLEHFPHLLLVQNKALMADFAPRNFRSMQQIYRQIFHKSKLQKESNLGLATSQLISCLNENTCGEPFNLFLIPEYNADPSIVYCGHPPMEELVKKMRANILGAVKEQLTHVQLTEKTWLNYCSKVWDNVRKSSFFVEYTKLMPYFYFSNKYLHIIFLFSPSASLYVFLFLFYAYQLALLLSLFFGLSFRPMFHVLALSNQRILILRCCYFRLRYLMMRIHYFRLFYGVFPVVVQFHLDHSLIQQESCRPNHLPFRIWPD